jgi:hypothetical protein
MNYKRKREKKAPIAVGQLSKLARNRGRVGKKWSGTRFRTQSI